MPIAPSKWRKRSERKSHESRAQAKRRVLPRRDSRGRFCRPTLMDLAADTARDEINRLLAQEIMVNGQPYRAREITQQLSPYTAFTNPWPQAAITFTPVYPLYHQLVPQPLYNTYTAGTNYMANSPGTNAIWNTWNTGNIGNITNYYNTLTAQTQTQTIRNPEIVWTGWVQDVNQIQRDINQQYANYQQRVQPPVLTPEEMAARQVRLDQERHQRALREAEQAARNAVVKEAQDKAMARALATFLDILTPEQRKTYEKEQCIYVRSQHGRRYRIECRTSQSGNVSLLDHRGRRTHSFCVHPSYDRETGRLLPTPDAWATQKLYLEHMEDEFLKVANVHTLETGWRPAGFLGPRGQQMPEYAYVA